MQYLTKSASLNLDLMQKKRYGILLRKLFRHTVRKTFCKFETGGRELAKGLRSLEQFNETVIGQNNF